MQVSRGDYHKYLWCSAAMARGSCCLQTLSTRQSRCGAHECRTDQKCTLQQATIRVVWPDRLGRILFTLLLPRIKKGLGKHVILGDNLSLHINIAVLEACQQNNIAFVLSPPNATPCRSTFGRCLLQANGNRSFLNGRRKAKEGACHLFHAYTCSSHIHCTLTLVNCQ